MNDYRYSIIEILNNTSELLAYKTANYDDDYYEQTITDLRSRVVNLYKGVIYTMIHRFPPNPQTKDYLVRTANKLFNDAQSI